VSAPQECMIFALAMITKNKITNNNKKEVINNKQQQQQNNTGVHFDWTTLQVHHDEYPEAKFPEAHDDTRYNNNDKKEKENNNNNETTTTTITIILQECVGTNVCPHPPHCWKAMMGLRP